MNRRLYRSRTDSVLGGVCGGIADYLDVDPSIVRIIWAVLGIVTGGVFVVLYVVMWIVVPEAPAFPAAAAEGEGEGAAAGPSVMTTPVAPRRRGSGSGSLIFGLLLVGLGAYFLVREYLPQIDVDTLWPIGLVLLGLLLVVASLRNQRSE
jgi:phage shock protein C